MSSVISQEFNPQSGVRFRPKSAQHPETNSQPTTNTILYDAKKKKNITISYEQSLCPYHEEIANLVMRFATSKQNRVLDFGCGVGNCLAAVHRKMPNLEFTIADIDPKCLQITEKKVPVSKAYQLGSSHDIEVVDQDFDIILLSHVLQYDKNPTATMQQLLGMLRPGGFLIVATPNPVAFPILLNNLLRRDYSKGNAFIWDRSVFKGFLANCVGGHLHQISQDYVPLPLVTRFRMFRPIEKMLAKLLPWFAFSIIAVVGNERKV